MQKDANAQRYLELIAQLNVEQRWDLSPQEQGRYVERLAVLYVDGDHVDDAKLGVIARNYHADHALVEALVDSDDPEHAIRWEEWKRHALGIVRAKLGGGQHLDGAVTGVEDLVQEALHDVWRGLGSFRYQSRFSTWAFMVVSHCLVRQYRALQTQKRYGAVQAQSLEALPALGETVADPSAAPDQVAVGRALHTFVQHLLAQESDHRLALVFHLWANEDQTLRMIGEQLHLSAARVHALLTQALALVRDTVWDQGWQEFATLPPTLLGGMSTAEVEAPRRVAALA